MTRFALIPCIFIASACATDDQAVDNVMTDAREIIDATYANAAKEAGPSDSTGVDGVTLGQWLVELAIDELGDLAESNNCEIVGALGGRWTSSNLQYRARIFNLKGAATDNVVGKFIFDINSPTGVIKGRTSRNSEKKNGVQIAGEFMQTAIEAEILQPAPSDEFGNGDVLTLFGEWRRTPHSSGGHMLGVVARCD